MSCTTPRDKESLDHTNVLETRYKLMKTITGMTMKQKKGVLLGKAGGVIFVLIISVLGIFMAWRFGFGWFFLFQTVREFLFAVPWTYRVIMQMVGVKYVEELDQKLARSQFFISPALGRRAIFSLVLTMLVFWKANIPLHKVIDFITP
jgi:hypothetical protein